MRMLTNQQLERKKERKKETALEGWGYYQINNL